jgi:hypothetical protein
MQWTILIAVATSAGSTLDVDPLACRGIEIAVGRVVSAQIGAPIHLAIRCGPYVGPGPIAIPRSMLPVPPRPVLPQLPPGPDGLEVQ